MPKIEYVSKRFNDEKLAMIRQAISILRNLSGQGYQITLRQLYYQFVARDLFPAKWADAATGSTNNQRSYDKLGVLLADARLAGLMDWTALVDLTREMGGVTHWSSPSAIMDAVASQYRIDKWDGQKYRPEVWVEKDALSGVVGNIAKQLDIPYFSCRGYTSLTTIWENAQRLKKIAIEGATPVVLHLGDHDPSGIDMSRDIEERVRMFMDEQGDHLKFERLALNMDQVTRYRPPENPAKATDCRFEKYRELYGESSWELDALEPSVISDIVSSAVDEYRNDRKYAARQATETRERDLLKTVSTRWDLVEEMFSDGGEK